MLGTLNTHILLYTVTLHTGLTLNSSVATISLDYGLILNKFATTLTTTA